MLAAAGEEHQASAAEVYGAGEGPQDRVGARDREVWLEAEIGGGAAGERIRPRRLVVPVESGLAVARESSEGCPSVVRRWATRPPVLPVPPVMRIVIDSRCLPDETIGMFVERDNMCDRLPVDVVSALVDGPRAQRAFALKAVFDGTWSVTIEDRAPLTLVVMARGGATFTRGEATQVGVGDVVVVRGPAPYTFADSVSTPADIRTCPARSAWTQTAGSWPRTWNSVSGRGATVAPTTRPSC